MSESRSQVFRLTASLCLLWLSTAEAADLLPPVVTTPTGAFRSMRLTLSKGTNPANPADVRFIARDGKVVQSFVWFVNPNERNGAGAFADTSGLSIEGDRLKGDYVVLSTHNRDKINYRHVYTIDAKIVGETVTGTYTVTVDGVKPTDGRLPTDGQISGTMLSEAAIAKQEAVDATISWPQFLSGPRPHSAAATKYSYVDDLSKARLVWRSEAFTGHGPGGATRTRKDVMSSLGRGAGSYTLTGGGASPVLAEGRVFQFFHQGSGEVGDAEIEASQAKNMDAFTKAVGEYWTNMERRRWKVRADDIVVATDAATGKTLWTTVLPERGFNWTDHKNSYCNYTPVVIGKILVAFGSTSRIYGLDTASGKLLWERTTATSDLFEKLMADSASKKTLAIGIPKYMSTRAGGGAATIADGMVFTADNSGNLLCLDPATGKDVWVAKGGSLGKGVLYVMRIGTDAAVLSDNDVCYDAKTGKELWKMPEAKDLPAGGAANVSDFAQDDIVVRSHPADTVGKLWRWKAWRAGKDSLTQLWDVTIEKDCAHGYRMAIRGDTIYAISNVNGERPSKITNCAIAVSLKDGLLKSYVPVTHLHNASSLEIFDDRMMVRIDSAHGGSNFWLAKLDDKGVGELPCTKTIWPGIHATTSTYNGSYDQSPIVDGRLFIRGGDGLYCYDLRSPANP